MINKIAGGYSGAGEAKRIARLKEMYSEVEVAYIPGTVPDFSGAEAIVVQGGDGTLNRRVRRRRKAVFVCIGGGHIYAAGVYCRRRVKTTSESFCVYF